jgi:hypothetical protein
MGLYFDDDNDSIKVASVIEVPLTVERLVTFQVGSYRSLGRLYDAAAYFCDSRQKVIRSFVPDYYWPELLVKFARLLRPAEQANVHTIVHVTWYRDSNTPQVVCMIEDNILFPTLLRQVPSRYR